MGPVALAPSSGISLIHGKAKSASGDWKKKKTPLLRRFGRRDVITGSRIPSRWMPGWQKHPLDICRSGKLWISKHVKGTMALHFKGLFTDTVSYYCDSC